MLQLFLQPRAAKSEWAGHHDGRIRLRITAPPIDNQANKDCVKFISKSLKTAKSNVSIVRGKTSRSKTIEILSADPERWREILKELEHF